MKRKISIPQTDSKIKNSKTRQEDAVDQITKFASVCNIILCEHLDNYQNRVISKKRIELAFLFRLCSLITVVRYLLSTAFNTKLMVVLMSNSNFLITNPRIFSLFVSLAASCILLISLLLQVTEMKYKLTLLDFFLKWKNKRLLPLNSMNTRRMTWLINLMTNFVMKEAFCLLLVFNSCLFFGPTIQAYLDPASGFLLIPIILHSLCLFIWLVQFMCIVSAGFVALSVPFFYLKYKFKELEQQIKWCVKYNNQMQLMRAIRQHNVTALETKAIDDVFKFVVFYLYVLGSPALIVLMVICQIRETVAIARLFSAIIVIIEYFVVFYLNLFSAQISHSARKPTKLLYKFLIGNPMPINVRFKVMQFIEKLIGPDIGFYCWNNFPMNNYTFCQYLAYCMGMYILILNLYNKIK